MGRSRSSRKARKAELRAAELTYPPIIDPSEGMAPPEPELLGASWWTIEVKDRDPDVGGGDGSVLPGNSARRWKDARGAGLIEAALTHGAKDWSWTVTDWGVVFEVAFADEADWLRFRATPAVSAALDAVPDPVNGLFVHPGRGGSSGARAPRRPRPRPLAGAAVPEPEPERERGDACEPLGQYLCQPPTR